PVFLLNVGVVIFVVSTAAGEKNRLGTVTEMAQEVVVEKLGSVVAVESKQGEWKRLFDVADLHQDIGFASAPNSTLFTPAGGNINTINGIGELASHGFATVSDGVCLKETRFALVPLL